MYLYMKSYINKMFRTIFLRQYILSKMLLLQTMLSIKYKIDWVTTLFKYNKLLNKYCKQKQI